MLNFVECFFSVYGDDHVFFVLFVDVVDDDDGFSNVVPSLSALIFEESTKLNMLWDIQL